MSQRDVVCIVAAIAIAAVTVGIDLRLPPGFADGTPHLALLGPALLSRSVRTLMLLAVAATGLVVACQFAGGGGADVVGPMITHRVLVVVGIWAGAYVVGRQIQTDTRHREDELRFRDFAESSSDWLWETDSSLRYTYLSPRFEEVTGIPAEAVIGRRRTEFRLPDDDPQEWTRHNADLLARRPFKDFQLKFRGPDGQDRHRSVSGKPVFDEYGQFKGYRGIGRDVTEEILAQEREAAARAAQRALADAIELIDVGVALYDADDRLAICNRKYKDIYRRFATHLVPGVSHRELVDAAIESGQYQAAKGEPEDFRKMRLAARQGQEAIELQLDDGRWIMLRDIKTAHGTVAFRIDVTHRREVEDALRQSEQRYRDIIDSASDWFWEMDADLRFTHISPRFATLTGLDIDDLLGRSRTAFACDEDPESWQGHIADLAARRPFRNLRYGAAMADGTRRFFSVSGTPVFDKQGAFRGYRGSGADVTAQVTAEAALRESEARFKALVENLPAAVFLRGVDERFLLANQQFRTWYCRGARDPVGETIGTVFRPDDAARFREMDAQVRRTLTRCGDETVQTFADGTERTVTITEFPVLDRAGVLIATGGIITDVDTYKRLESDLRRALSSVEQANRAKSEFLANVSHELRTPLNAIIGFSDIIRREAFGPIGAERYREYADDINASGNHLLAIINDILDMAKIEAGEIELRETEVTLAEEVLAVLRIIQSRADAGFVRLVSSVTDGLPRLYADRRMLRQILLNLLSNGVKFTPEGGRVTVSARLDPADGTFLLEVADTGIGIAEQDLELVMSPFQQADSALSRKFEGTGLGLPLVKSMIELHGGALSLNSRVGKGTVVTIRFPCSRVLKPEERPLCIAAAGD